MAENTVENEAQDVPELDETLEILLLQSIEQAQNHMEDGEDVVPFTALLIDESVYQETHVGTTEECFASAREAIEESEGARAYAFCYDGFVETDEGDKDAIIAEGGIPGAGEGVAVGLIYEVDDNGITFDEEVCFIAEAPNYLAGKAAAEAEEE